MAKMSILPHACYRVSAKAIIRDTKGQVLFVKEHSDDWVLPGGGIDFGEDAEAALARELQEELGEITIHDMAFSSMYTLLTRKGIWYMWLLYHVRADISQPESCQSITYMNIADIQGDETRNYRHILAALKKSGL